MLSVSVDPFDPLGKEGINQFSGGTHRQPGSPGKHNERYSVCAAEKSLFIL